MLTLVLGACAQGPRIEIVGSDGAVRTAVERVEIADDSSSREYGLMFHAKHLDEDAGMIFIFKAPEHQQFWMKNTIIPLDMIFADGNGKIIGIVSRAEPFSEAIDAVDGDTQYVLEVNGGFCERHRVEPGDVLRFVGFLLRSSRLRLCVAEFADGAGLPGVPGEGPEHREHKRRHENGRGDPEGGHEGSAAVRRGKALNEARKSARASRRR